MSSAEHVNNEQFHITNDQFWYRRWRKNLEEGPSGGWKEHHQRLPDGEFHEWISSDWFTRRPFPTQTLMATDIKVAEPERVWSPNPNVARRQRVVKRPAKGTTSMRAWENHAQAIHETTHELMKGTGVPEHVTVYRFGHTPEDALYGSGSVDPDWPRKIRSGESDLPYRRRKLHITLVPHEDIMHTAGVEGEVFYRRGTQLNKTKRSMRRQKEVEARHRDSWEGETESGKL